MAMNYPSPGPNDVGSYLISGIPWVTGSTVPAATIVHYTFPCVTRTFVVRNTAAAGTTLAVGFTANGLNSVFRNYFTLTGGQEEKLDLRVKDLYVSATQGTVTIEIVAGLTQVPYDQFPVLTGSLTGSALFSGVG